MEEFQLSIIVNPEQIINEVHFKNQMLFSFDLNECIRTITLTIGFQLV